MISPILASADGHHTAAGIYPINFIMAEWVISYFNNKITKISNSKTKHCKALVRNAILVMYMAHIQIISVGNGEPQRQE